MVVNNLKYSHVYEGMFSDYDYHDIIECAARNDFDGVNAALESNPECINMQRAGIEVSALMVAAGFGLERMVEHLLNQPGADFSLRDSFGMNAIEHGRAFPNVVRILLSSEHPGHVWGGPEFPDGPN